MSENQKDYIHPDLAGDLHSLFRERVRRTPRAVAYRQYDAQHGVWQDTTWEQTAKELARWQRALRRESLQRGDRVAIMARNCREWVVFDQAALSLGLVVVPLFTEDRPENVAHILGHSDARLLVIGGNSQWLILQPVLDELNRVQRIVTLHPLHDHSSDVRLRELSEWLPADAPALLQESIDPDGIASIVYTSGTTGRPKGVMLSHRNMVWNAWAGLQYIDIYPQDLFLSFLPLSHTLERTAGYYIPLLAGATVAFARSINELAEDLTTLRPTALVSVPRIFERVSNKLQAQLAERPPLARRLFLHAVDLGWKHFLHQQGRYSWTPAFMQLPLLQRLVGKKVLDKLGGRVRVTVCGGAPLSADVARTFIGLGLPLIQGYGLTENSPVISVNRMDDNDPESVGHPLPGIEVKIGKDQELLVRGPSVMRGYWKDPEATEQVIDEEGWLHTGDQVHLKQGRLYITGRLKEIIVLSNGEKVSPADMEMAISGDPLFEQVMVVGECRPFLSALVVLNQDQWLQAASGQCLQDPNAEPCLHLILDRIGKRLREFPGYAKVRRAVVCKEPWSIENALLTPTMKQRRMKILERYRDELDRLYDGPQ